jgi:regulator of replication initiation timing
MLNRDEEEKVDYTKLEITSISDLLIELDSVKRELYEQIEANKVIKLEKQKLKKEFHDMESEMQATIQGY